MNLEILYFNVGFLPFAANLGLKQVKINPAEHNGFLTCGTPSTCYRHSPKAMTAASLFRQSGLSIISCTNGNTYCTTSSSQHDAISIRHTPAALHGFHSSSSSPSSCKHTLITPCYRQSSQLCIQVNPQGVVPLGHLLHLSLIIVSSDMYCKWHLQWEKYDDISVLPRMFKSYVNF